MRYSEILVKFLRIEKFSVNLGYILMKCKLRKCEECSEKLEKFLEIFEKGF